MPRVDPEHLAAEAATRVFIAFKLAEAQRVETLLSDAGVTYAVAAEPVGRTLFGSARTGAVFSVAGGEVRLAVMTLTRAGLSAGLLVDSDD